jgi:serine/threonine-protein kinase HipA
VSMRTECIVFVYLPGQWEAVPAGLWRIVQAGLDATSTFVYGSGYRKRPDAIALDPVELALPDRDGLVLRPQGGKTLFGVFRDAAPDAWGRLVINERYLRRSTHEERIANAFSLPEVEYLLRSRPDRVGHLDFRQKPTDEPLTRKISGAIHLHSLVREAHRIALGKPGTLEVLTLLQPATGMGGARPKSTIQDADGLWLAKFPMENDVMPITRIEHAMLGLAHRCGITTIEHKLMDVEGIKEPVFLIRRFDRVPSATAAGQFERRGYFSSLTVLGLDEYQQSMGSYQDIADALLRHGEPALQQDERVELFRRMVFNALVNNDDDHLRNHGVLRTGGERMTLAPVFDIVPRVQVAGVSTQRRLAIRVSRRNRNPSEGRQVSIDNLLDDTEPFGLSRDEARVELGRIACVVRNNWRECCECAGIDSKVIFALEETMGYADEVSAALERDCDQERGGPTSQADARSERSRGG